MRAVALLVLLSACSFTTASGFTECSHDLQCGAGQACTRRYCVPMPAGCQRFEGPFEDAGVIRIAALLPLRPGGDGGADPAELNLLYGMALAVSDVNAQKTQNLAFGLYACDTQANDVLTATQLEWAIGQMQLPALITSGNALTLRAAQNGLRRDAGTLVMSPNASAQGLIDIFQSDHATFRIAPPDWQQASVLVQLLTGDEQYITQTKVAVVYQNDEARDELAHEISGRVADAGRNTLEFPYPAKVDAIGLIAKIKIDLGPTASVLIGAPAQIQSVISEASTSIALERANGHRWLLTSSAKSPALFVTPVVARQLEGALGVAPTQGKDTVFASRIATAYGVDSLTAPSGYDAAFMVMLSAAWDLQSGTPPTGPRMALGMLSMTSDAGAPSPTPVAWQYSVTQIGSRKPISMSGITGQLNFDLNAGAPSLPFEVWRVTDGGFTSVRLATP